MKRTKQLKDSGKGNTCNAVCFSYWNSIESACPSKQCNEKGGPKRGRRRKKEKEAKEKQNIKQCWSGSRCLIRSAQQKPGRTSLGAKNGRISEWSRDSGRPFKWASDVKHVEARRTMRPENDAKRGRKRMPNELWPTGRVIEWSLNWTRASDSWWRAHKRPKSTREREREREETRCRR